MNPIAIVLIGAAGFLAYTSYTKKDSKTPATGSQPGSGSNPPAGGGGSNAGGTPPAGGGSGNPPAGGGSNPAPAGGGAAPSIAQLSSQQILLGAASGRADMIALAQARNLLLNIDQWNWYREQAGSQAIDSSYMPDLIGAGDRDDLISASEYRRRLASVGLGRTRRPDWRFV